MRICVLVMVGPWPSNSKWLDECLESIRQQTRPADEVIIIDDGARPDEPWTWRWKQLLNLRVLSTPWVIGPGMLNWAIAESNSTWFFYCDSDDKMLPRCLEYAEGRAREIGVPCLVRVPVMRDGYDAETEAGQCLFHKKVWAACGGYSERFPLDWNFFDRMLRWNAGIVNDMVQHRREMFWHREHPDSGILLLNATGDHTGQRRPEWIRRFGFDPTYLPRAEDFE